MKMEEDEEPSSTPTMMGDGQVTPLQKDMISRLRAIIWAARDAIVMMDHRGRISLWNPSAEKILGYKSDQVMGKDLHEVIVPPEYRERHRDAFPEYLQGDERHPEGQIMEMHAMRKNGQRIPVEMSLSRVKIQGEWHAVAVIRDTRDRKKSERTLEKTKQKYRAVFENTGAATLIIEKDTTISLVNKKFEELIGYSKNEIEGKKAGPSWWPGMNFRE